MVHSVLERLDPGQIVLEPQPYVYSTAALDPDYYAELAAAYPSLETVAGPGPLENNRAYLRQAREVIGNPAMPAIWREFFAYHPKSGGRALGKLSYLVDSVRNGDTF